MTLKYKVIHQQAKADNGTEKDLYYARACQRGLVDLNAVAGMLASRSSVSRGDVYLTLIGLTDLIPQLLLENKAVSLGELGIISLHFGSEVKPNKADVTHRCIKNLKVQFRAGKLIKDALRFPNFKRVKE